MVNFNTGCWIYFSDVEKINYLQRKMIICSIIYYELNESIIPDKQFDEEARQLVKLQKQNKKDLNKSEYYYCMKDFDGTTGYDLFNRLKESDRIYLLHLAKYILKLYKERN